MRTLVISDTHFGAWTGDPLLQHEWARRRLAEALDSIDELVLLGDLFDFLFSPVQDAFANADGFFSLLEQKLAGKRVVFLAGNHDHHIVVRELRTAVELRVGVGDEGLERAFAMHRSFFQRFLDRRLPKVETMVAYPLHQVGDVLCFHGHYLDAHVRGSLPDRLLHAAIWRVAGGRPPEGLEIEDYEAIIIPLTELLFTVAQLPRGTAAQQAFQHQLGRLGRILSLASTPRRELRRIRCRLDGKARSVAADVARSCSVIDPPSEALHAYGQVVRNLGWDKLASKMVFGHTHQPLDGVLDEACGALRFWNTGSWIYEPVIGSQHARERYLDLAWPGTAVLIDTALDAPRLLRLLSDQNPRLRSPGPVVPRPRGHHYRVVAT
jgi:UDP-2,3-diacylglucosamine pyrophosphatase LpxH